MNLSLKKAVTLLELIIAITLLVIVVMGFSSIDLFSRNQVITSDKRAQVQNEVAYVLEHMTKQINKAIGNEWVYGSDTVIQWNQTIPNKNVLIIKQDTAEPYGKLTFTPLIESNPSWMPTTTPADQWVGYEYYKQDAANGDQYELKYCSNYLLGGRRRPIGGFTVAPVCQDANYGESLSKRITDINVQVFANKEPDTNQKPCYNFLTELPPNYCSTRCLASNYFNITVTGCWDPTETTAPCGSPNNPSVNMTSRITMPSVSTE